MTQPETPIFDEALIRSIVNVEPELELHCYPAGTLREEAASLVAGLFGKYWYVETQDFERAGMWRDVEKDAIEHLDDFEAKRLRSLVIRMFDHSGEKKAKLAEL